MKEKIKKLKNRVDIIFPLFFTKKKLILFLLIIGLQSTFVASVFAQENQTQTVVTSEQMRILEYKIELMETINNKILNTIYWALSGLITIFLAIIGLNFFQNFSLNKRKMDTIKEGIDKKLKLEIDFSRKELNAVISMLQKKYEKDLNLFNKKIETKIQSEIKTSFKELKGKFDNLEEDYKELNRENLIMKAFDYKKKNKMGYILNLVRVLEYDIEKNWDWRINKSLELIIECLDSFFPDSNSLTKLQLVLNKLPAEYNLQKQKIQSKMKL